MPIVTDKWHCWSTLMDKPTFQKEFTVKLRATMQCMNLFPFHLNNTRVKQRFISRCAIYLVGLRNLRNFVKYIQHGKSRIMVYYTHRYINVSDEHHFPNRTFQL